MKPRPTEIAKPEYAWPTDWRDHGRWTNLWRTLAGHYGELNANQIARGEDIATNRDIAAWRRIEFAGRFRI